MSFNHSISSLLSFVQLPLSNVAFIGLPVLYIDEKAGSDFTGTGAELSPFSTPLAAYQAIQPPISADASPTTVVTLLVRKADSVERNEWIEMSASGKKKLVKAIEAWRRKEAKKATDGDKAERERKEGEERERKRREEATGVILVDDVGRGQASKVTLYLCHVVFHNKSVPKVNC